MNELFTGKLPNEVGIDDVPVITQDTSSTCEQPPPIPPKAKVCS